MKRRYKWWDTTLRDPAAYSGIGNVVCNRLGNYETARQAVAWGSGNTVSLQVTASDCIQKTDGTARLFACTGTRIYEVTSSAVTDRSAGGIAYASGTEWNAAQYGDVTVYTNRLANVQASSAGAFADLAGTPPKAKYVCTQSLAVALAAYNDGVNTYEDGVWISDIGDHTTWTPASSNEAANFRLLQTPGAITGIVGFKGDIIAFKANSYYRLSYVGLPNIWNAKLISDNVGAAGQGLICVCGDSIVFGGSGGWYVFDGQTHEQIAPNYSPRTGGIAVVSYNTTGSSSHYEPFTGLVHFAVSGTTDGTVTFQMTRGEGYGAVGYYQTVTSAGSVSKRCLVRGTAAAMVAAGIGSTGTMNSASYFLASASNSAPFSMSAIWGAQSVAATASVTTNYFGEPRKITTFARVTPVLGYWNNVVFVGTCVGTTSKRSDYGDTPGAISGTQSVAADNPRFDFGKAARFAKFVVSVTTVPMEIEDILVDIAATTDG